MLIKRATLNAIAAGEVTLAFRRWKRPTVRTGGRLRTAVGELAIDAVDVVTLKSLTEKDSRAAGFASLAELKDALRGREGKLYRVRLHLAGEDARIALRKSARLSRRALEEVTGKLSRMDARSKDGPWTRAYLCLLREHPATRAGDLASGLGLETPPFKQRVRRLKELGLTESLKVGYRLSPRGAALLTRVEETG
jgi:hypothetical protein